MSDSRLAAPLRSALRGFAFAPRRRWLREPLVHFLLIGALVFGVSTAIDSVRRESLTIAVTPTVRQTIEEMFAEQNGRPPTQAELSPLLDAWVRNEVMYREALAMGLDKGDDMIRERIIHKMRVLVFGDVTIGAASPSELRAWFEKNRRRYDTPLRYSFLDLPVDGNDARIKAEAILRQIVTGEEPEALRTRVRAYVARNQEAVAATFGAGFVDHLRRLPLSEWSLLQGDGMWHVVRLDGIHEAEPVAFEAVEANVAVDWEQEQRRTLALRAVQDMNSRYNILRQEGPAGARPERQGGP